MLAEREPDRYALHTQHLNEMMVRVLQRWLRRRFRSGQGQYLIDRAGSRFLTSLSGMGGVWMAQSSAVARYVEPGLRRPAQSRPKWMCSVLAGLLAERFAGLWFPFSTRFFTNSGARPLKLRSKFARRATRRPGIVYCDQPSMVDLWRLVANGDPIFREGFGPLVPGFAGHSIQ